MKTQFPIKEGTLEFFEDYIEIRDKWKFAKFYYRFFPIATMAYPVALVFTRKINDGQWWFGVVLTSIMIIGILYFLISGKRRIFHPLLQIDQIQKVEIEKYSHDNRWVKIYLKNRSRRLVEIDFDRFWQADLKEAFESNRISVAII
jgi:hypothetical protein